jgi:hypothetical protein
MFEQAKLKIRWAGKMLTELGGGLKNFAAEQSCEVHSHHNPKTKELRLKVVGEYAPVWPSLILLAGTCAHTINSSLDYVTSEIVNTARATDRRIVFPMDVDRDQLEASNAIKTIRNLNPDLASFILDEIKPTKVDNFPIWGVRNLANTDKHRNLVLAAHTQGFEIGRIKKAGMEMANIRFLAQAGAQNEGYFSIPDVEEYSDPEAIIQVSFREPDLSHPNRFYRLEALEFLSNGMNAAAEVINAAEEFLGGQIR